MVDVMTPCVSVKQLGEWSASKAAALAASSSVSGCDFDAIVGEDASKLK